MTDKELLEKRIEERELLHAQLKLLAEKSSDSSGTELVMYTELMCNVFVILNQ